VLLRAAPPKGELVGRPGRDKMEEAPTLSRESRRVQVARSRKERGSLNSTASRKEGGTRERVYRVDLFTLGTRETPAGGELFLYSQKISRFARKQKKKESLLPRSRGPRDDSRRPSLFSLSRKGRKGRDSFFPLSSPERNFWFLLT